MCKNVFFKSSVLKNFTNNYRKKTVPESLFNKFPGPQQIFYRRLLQQLARTFNGIWSSKKYSENVYISLKTKSKHQVTYSKEKSNYEVT